MRSNTAAVDVRAVATRDVSRAFLLRALEAAAPRRDRGDLIVTVPAPVARPDALLCGSPEEASMLWDPPENAACAGLGVARRLPPDVAQVEAFFAHAAVVAYPGAPPPRVFGGASFAPGHAQKEPWKGFGEGFLSLPRWGYHVDQHAWLTVAVAGSDSVDVPGLLDRFDRIWGSLECPVAVIPVGVSSRRIDEVDLATWTQQVQDIRHKIREGVFEKVVAARHCVVELDGGAGPLHVLRRLEERFAGCTRFAIWKGAAAFLGATPELLISRRGPRVLSEALAGSTKRGDAERMLRSTKEREEHQIVVRGVLAALSPFCETLESSKEPRVRELPNVLHMQTQIEGRLAESTHALSLVEALQPTPAVGGVPVDEAIRWIGEHEQLPRGWFSAPVGWVDARGDGEFVVALRSGLLRDRRAWVYAGAGIMADSDPEAEYAETELKMQALLGALG